MIAKLLKFARTFRDSEDGNGTLEFVMVLPGFLLLFTSAYEGGVMSTRHVMLERGLDSTVRDIRIGRLFSPSGEAEDQHKLISDRICEYASIIPNCSSNLRLEMIPNDLRAWTSPNNTVACVDREETGDPVLNLTAGGNNELMILRACVLFEPMVPTTGLGRVIPKESGTAYGLVATSSYVMEPFQKKN